MPEYLTLLDRAALTDLGVGDWPYGYADRVRFGEIDALNHVNNVTFLKWFENLRVRYVQDYDFTKYRPEDPMLVVRRVTADYHAPMFQNEDYVLTARTLSFKASSFVMDYAVHSGGTLRATGEAVVISLQQDGKTRRAHAPQAIENMVSRDGAEQQD